MRRPVAMLWLCVACLVASPTVTAHELDLPPPFNRAVHQADAFVLGRLTVLSAPTADTEPPAGDCEAVLTVERPLFAPNDINAGRELRVAKCPFDTSTEIRGWLVTETHGGETWHVRPVGTDRSIAFASSLLRRASKLPTSCSIETAVAMYLTEAIPDHWDLIAVATVSGNVSQCGNSYYDVQLTIEEYLIGTGPEEVTFPTWDGRCQVTPTGPTLTSPRRVIDRAMPRKGQRILFAMKGSKSIPPIYPPIRFFVIDREIGGHFVNVLRETVRTGSVEYGCK